MLAISLVTNLAAGISPARLSSQEVIETAEASAARVIPFLTELLASL